MKTRSAQSAPATAARGPGSLGISGIAPASEGNATIKMEEDAEAADAVGAHDENLILPQVKREESDEEW